jgi:hypothetical protein
VHLSELTDLLGQRHSPEQVIGSAYRR